VVDENLSLDTTIKKVQEDQEPDEDGDGVFDENDKCPHTLVGFSVDGDGCPQTATVNVIFGPDRYDLTPAMSDEILKFSDFLKRNPAYQVIIYGYTDSRGDEKTNKILSQNRADAIMNALIENGVKPSKLTAIGRGESNPIASNMYKIGREKNRRIEIILIQ
jgi:OOP family OmpA-OmpF porin